MSIVEEQDHNLVEPTPNLRVVSVDPQTDPRWEALVAALPNGLIYHHPAWLQVLEEAYGYKPVSLGCEDAEGQLQGILPLFYLRGLLTGCRFSSLPRTPVAGPLVYNSQAAAALVHAAVERVRDEPRALLQIKALSNTFDGLVDGVACVPWRADYILDLPQRPELLHLDSRVKRAVNRASRMGVEVHPAETERELRAWYELYLDTMRRVAVPARPYRFFKVAWQQLQPRGLLRLLLATRGEAGHPRLLGGLLLLMGGQTTHYAEGGWRLEEQALRPNDALHWQAIQDACAEGFRYYDFGEVAENNPGLAEFKSKWGSQEKWLYRYYYPAPRELEIRILEKVRPLAGGIWRRLPIKATALLSDWAHRYF